MNQEEWLAERRRLGLPADPTKDFPPNYRHDPNEESDRFTREHPERRSAKATAPRATPPPPPTALPPRPRTDLPSGPPTGARAGQSRPAPFQGQAPHPSAAPRRQPRPQPLTPAPQFLGAARPAASPFKLSRFVTPLLVLALIVGSQIVRSISNSSSSSPSSFATGSKAQAMETEAETAATAAVRALTSGKLKGIGYTAKRNSLLDTSTFTPAAAAIAFGSHPTFSITYTRVAANETEASVNGTLISNGNKTPVTVNLSRSSPSQKWVVEPLSLPILSGFDGVTGSFKVNGVSVDLAKIRAAGDELGVWPGVTTVVPPADKYTSWPEAKLSQAYSRTIEFGSPGSGYGTLASPQTFDDRPVRTPAFLQDAKTAALANLDRCIAAGDIEAAGCPFHGSLPSDVTRTRNVKITLLEAPSEVTLIGSYGNETLSSTPGKVDASGQGLHAGSWTPFRGTLQVDLNGSVGTKNGKVVYRE